MSSVGGRRLGVSLLRNGMVDTGRSLVGDW
jgi:hypothetical protein